MPNQWAHSSQLSMSRQTQALKHSMPNQWAHSFEPKKPFFIAQLSKSTWTQAFNRSMPNQWA